MVRLLYTFLVVLQTIWNTQRPILFY